MKKPVNKIEKLIAEMCPDEVEFKALGEVTELKRGTSISETRTRRAGGLRETPRGGR